MGLVSLQSFRDRVRSRADMQHSTFIGDTELTDFINASCQELYDLLIDSNEDYHTQLSSFVIASGNSYTLPATFYKLRGLDKRHGDRMIPLRRMSFNDRGYRRVGYYRTTEYKIVGNEILFFPQEAATGTYNIWWVPEFTKLVALSDTFDCLNGFDEYVVVDAAIKCKEKEESDTRGLKDEKQALLDRVQRMSNDRDYGEPQMIEDVTSRYNWWDADV